MRHTVISGVDKNLQGHLCNKFGYSAPDDVFVDKEKHTHTDFFQYRFLFLK